MVKPKKEGMERENLHTIYIHYRTEKKAGRFEREREREREERGKGAFAVGDRFCRHHFFTNQNNRPHYVCRQPNAAKVVVVGPS